MSLTAILALISQLAPLMNELWTYFANTPEEQRAAAITNIHNAFISANTTKGDTSQIEAVIKGAGQ